MVALTATAALVCAIYAWGREHRRGPYFHALLQFQVMGLNGAFLTTDLFNLFVFFELLLIASYGLIGAYFDVDPLNLPFADVGVGIFRGCARCRFGAAWKSYDAIR